MIFYVTAIVDEMQCNEQQKNGERRGFLRLCSGFFFVLLTQANNLRYRQGEADGAGVGLGACLLHDGSEAYLSDVTRPVKEELPRYLTIERPLQEAIWNKWLTPALTQEEEDQIFEIDDALLYNEFVALMDTALIEPTPVLCAPAQFHFVDFETTKQEYLKLFYLLTA